jgi:hypothetical protein
MSIARMVTPSSAIRTTRPGYRGKREWVPSHIGGFPVFLHPHQAMRLASVIVLSIGVKLVPLCEPSQNGWLLERPQRHQ